MPPPAPPTENQHPNPGLDKKDRPKKRHWFVRLTLWSIGLVVAGALAVALVVGVALAMAYPNLPDVSELADYRPKLPLRVYSAEGALLGEFGEERRNLTPIKDIPEVMKDAVLAIEDTRFFQHGGVDYKGVLRAGLANLGRVKSQGASTITMQVARNVYLSSEKTFTRKIYEILLTFKLEHLLTKDQILEIYMNQIYLGNRAYGFAAASEAYFGKPLKQVSVAEAVAKMAGDTEVCVYRFGGERGRVSPDRYWNDLRNIDDYYLANMALLEHDPPLNLYQSDWKIFTAQGQNPPARTIPGLSGTEGIFVNSMLAAGTVISGGGVNHSILFPGVRVMDGAIVEDAILFNSVSVGERAHLRRCIVDKEVEVPPDTCIGINPAADKARFHISAGGLVVIPKGYKF